MIMIDTNHRTVDNDIGRAKLRTTRTCDQTLQYKAADRVEVCLCTGRSTRDSIIRPHGHVHIPQGTVDRQTRLDIFRYLLQNIFRIAIAQQGRVQTLAFWIIYTRLAIQKRDDPGPCGGLGCI